ncbi:MAG: SMP-30/gluconolactonase/LRE family protein [Bryobacterales bacterium]|nr:SMP-30/gluconolactonase/LRE family protein [Bryobacterales bacterium]
MRKLVLAAALSVAIFAQDTTNFPVLGKVVRLDPKLDELLAPDARLEVISCCFDWSEGPTWDRKGGFLLFSDIPRNSVMKWKEGEGISLFLKPSGYTGAVPYGKEPGSNGLLMDPEGRLLSAEHGDRRISILYPDGGKRTLADNYQGKRLNSPNDLTRHSSGAIYFTDPPYGLPNNVNDPRKELDFQGVFRVTPGGAVTLLTREMTRPNGMAFSPDEKTLYVAQSDPEKAIWMAFPVKDDGTLGQGKVLAEVTAMVGKMKGLPDGLKVDRAGNIWATAPGGIHIISPEGRTLGRIETGEATANCAWGDDGSTLYITTDMYLTRIRTRTKGAGW